MRDTILTSLGYAVVDTRHTVDCGWESMVFRSTEDGKITDGSPLAVDGYIDEDAARAGHQDLINRWKV